MNTVGDFKNAPVGAIASDPEGRKAVKTFSDVDPWDREGGWNISDHSMQEYGYTLDPVPSPAPTTVREALDLAWELADPVEEGQTIPKGVKYLERYSSGIREYVSFRDMNVLPTLVEYVRTLDPLPAPKPDWLDAPALLARHKDWGSPAVFEREDSTGVQWVRDSKVYHWCELTDITPLYPKEKEND